MKLKKTKKGFTLIELIVVVVVLAILAAVAVPMISSWVGRAEEAAAQANGRNVELAVKAYIAEHALDGILEANLESVLGEYGLSLGFEPAKYGVDVTSKGAINVGVAGEITEAGSVKFVNSL